MLITLIDPPPPAHLDLKTVMSRLLYRKPLGALRESSGGEEMDSRLPETFCSYSPMSPWNVTVCILSLSSTCRSKAQEMWLSVVGSTLGQLGEGRDDGYFVLCLQHWTLFAASLFNIYTKVRLQNFYFVASSVVSSLMFELSTGLVQIVEYWQELRDCGSIIYFATRFNGIISWVMVHWVTLDFRDEHTQKKLGILVGPIINFRLTERQWLSLAKVSSFGQVFISDIKVHVNVMFKDNPTVCDVCQGRIVMLMGICTNLTERCLHLRIFLTTCVRMWPPGHDLQVAGSYFFPPRTNCALWWRKSFSCSRLSDTEYMFH